MIHAGLFGGEFRQQEQALVAGKELKVTEMHWHALARSLVYAGGNGGTHL